MSRAPAVAFALVVGLALALAVASAFASRVQAQEPSALGAGAAGPWLGLDGNSGGQPVAALARFAALGVVYDRGGAPGIDWTAGELPSVAGTPTAAGRALARSLAAGMVPDVTIEYAGYRGDFRPDPRFPSEARGSATLREYVAGFVRSTAAILRANPGRRILFEAINEPWGYTTPQYDAAAYAAVIARLLPAARAAGIPLSDLYVAATGPACAPAAGAVACATEGWVPGIYRARPRLAQEIEGWYFHPYGPPSGAAGPWATGIAALPRLRARIASGRRNVIVSEVGYCDRALDPLQCRAPGYPDVATGAQGALALRVTLDHALADRRAGWLRALIVYAREDHGWEMQRPSGALTPAGLELEAFALFYGQGWTADDPLEV